MKHRNKILIIASILFVITAVALLVTGFYMAGEDVLAWFSSKWAFALYSVLAIYVIIIGSVLVGDWIKKL